MREVTVEWLESEIENVIKTYCDGDSFDLRYTSSLIDKNSGRFSGENELRICALKSRDIAVNLMEQNTQLPELPKVEEDPLVELQAIQQWCIEADLAKRQEENDTETAQRDLQEIMGVLKNLSDSKDIDAAKSTLPTIAKTYDILCRCKGQCGSKTTDAINWLGAAARDGSGYYPALLNELASPEVIADLESWLRKPTQAEQNTAPVKPEREGWWWKLYEKTLKALFTSFLEWLGPKP